MRWSHPSQNHLDVVSVFWSQFGTVLKWERFLNRQMGSYSISVSVWDHYHGYWDWDGFLNPGPWSSHNSKRGRRLSLQHLQWSRPKLYRNTMSSVVFVIREWDQSVTTTTKLWLNCDVTMHDICDHACMHWMELDGLYDDVLWWQYCQQSPLVDCLALVTTHSRLKLESNY